MIPNIAVLTANTSSYDSYYSKFDSYYYSRMLLAVYSNKQLLAVITGCSNAQARQKSKQLLNSHTGKPPCYI